MQIRSVDNHNILIIEPENSFMTKGLLVVPVNLVIDELIKLIARNRIEFDCIVRDANVLNTKIIKRFVYIAERFKECGYSDRYEIEREIGNGGQLGRLMVYEDKSDNMIFDAKVMQDNEKKLVIYVAGNEVENTLAWLIHNVLTRKAYNTMSIDLLDIYLISSIFHFDLEVLVEKLNAISPKKDYNKRKKPTFKKACENSYELLEIRRMKGCDEKVKYIPSCTSISNLHNRDIVIGGQPFNEVILKTCKKEYISQVCKPDFSTIYNKFDSLLEKIESLMEVK